MLIFDSTPRSGVSLDDRAEFLPVVNPPRTDESFNLIFHYTDGRRMFHRTKGISVRNQDLNNNPSILSGKDEETFDSEEKMVQFAIMHDQFVRLLPRASKVMVYSGDGGSPINQEGTKVSLVRFLEIEGDRLEIFDSVVPHENSSYVKSLFHQMLEILSADDSRTKQEEFKSSREAEPVSHLKRDIILFLQACGMDKQDDPPVWPWANRYRPSSQLGFDLQALAACLEADDYTDTANQRDQEVQMRILCAWCDSGILQPKDVLESTGKGSDSMEPQS